MSSLMTARPDADVGADSPMEAPGPVAQVCVARYADHRAALRAVERVRDSPAAAGADVDVLGADLHVHAPSMRDAWQALTQGVRAGLLYGALVGALLGIFGFGDPGVGVFALVLLGALIGGAIGAGIGAAMHALDRTDGGDATPVFARYLLVVDKPHQRAVRDVLTAGR